MRSGVLVAPLCGALAMFLVACGSAAVPVVLPPTPAPVQPGLPDSEGVGPAQLTGAFYHWYLEYARGGGVHRNPIADGAYRGGGYVSAGLSERIDAARAAKILNYDPFLCAQDVPGKISVGDADIQGDRASVRVTSDFANHSFAVLLSRSGDRWEISEVQCSPAGTGKAATATQAPGASPAATAGVGAGHSDITGWQVYVNEKHGFRVQYPVDWTYQEMVAGANQPPIGPANVALVVHFMPQEWADQMAVQRKGGPDPNAPVFAPFTLELSIGSLEEYRGAYPEPAERTEVSFDGRPAVREDDVLSDELRVIRYMFTDPADANRRITLVDYTSGFPQRLKGSEDVVQQFEAILPTLNWM